ncbi:MAG: glutaredoxin [Steroidobacteraceae bacterium]
MSMRDVPAEDRVPLRLYWQPGCTSCLRTREFLQSRGVAFESINVLASGDAMQALVALGVRTVPVLARGERFVLAQDLQEVARFVGIPYSLDRLPVAVLLERVHGCLELTAQHAACWPAASLRDLLPGRPRRHADLLYHVAMIVQGLLDATASDGNGRLDYEYFERRPAEASIDPHKLADLLRGVAEALRSAAPALVCVPANQPVATYYGHRPLHEVLERTAWHVAQHLRQVHHLLVEVLRRTDSPALDPGLLAGLPLPERVWDAEIQFQSPGALD